MVKFLKKHQLAYALLPSSRNQDIIKVITGMGGTQFVACVVDGWNNPEGIKGNKAGRETAKFVAKTFPKTFLATKAKNLQEKAEKAAELVDEQLLNIYPAHASCSAIFLFSYKKKDIIVAVGSGVVLIWNGKFWKKPKEIGDYSLDLKKYPGSDVSRFFGRGELKTDPFYSSKPDVVVSSPKKPVFLTTDGLEDVMTIKEINEFTQNLADISPRTFIANLSREIRKRGGQKDDIAILLKG